MKKFKILNYLILLITSIFILCGCSNNSAKDLTKMLNSKIETENISSASIDNIPAFTDNPYITINDNQPFFKDSDYTNTSFETYSDLDNLGRCGVAYANIGQDLMPKEKRDAIGMIKPSGWQTVKYDNVDGKYLYNRCHLIGYQLTAENANEKNLITGTRYLNIEGMLPFENMVADYIKETGNHVLYRVTPIYDGNNLVAKGVLMEGKSVEDKGAGICFNIFAYNNQPGIDINYATGESMLAADSSSSTNKTPNNNTNKSDENYVLNTNSHKFHTPECSGVSKIKASNKQNYTGSREKLIDEGYEPCKTCNP